MKRILQILFIALLLASLGQALWQHHQFPERVAAHFNASGQPDGWMSRTAHTTSHLATVLLTGAVFQGMALLNSRLPKDYLNIPHRDYWLAPKRAAASHAWISSALLLMGCALLVFFIGLFDLGFRANLNAPVRLDAQVWWAAGILATVAVGLVVAFFVRFGRKPAA